MEYVGLPREADMARFEDALSNRKRALRDDRQSTLLPYLQFVCHCRKKGYSYQDTSDLLQSAHQIKVHKTTIFRFVKKFPPLTSVADIKETSSLNDAVSCEGVK